jgi:DNA-binding IclR family transcriptional regulator
LEKQNPSSRKVIASVQNALNILNLFDSACPELGNLEIAKRLNMDPGTAAGLIYTLKVNQYLDQNPENRKYRLGWKIAERSAVLLSQLDLRRVARPHLELLRDWCGESVNLAILDRREVVYIERLFGHHALGIHSELGKRAPVHTTALGKAILAFWPPNDRDLFLNGYPFEPVTPQSITGRAAFEQDLALTCARRYALDEQENELGGRCIGAPIFDHQGRSIAAVSISVPVQRLPDELVSLYAERLVTVGERISAEIGFKI